ncbi:DUF2269 family protein [Paenibacillus sp. J22TS3]|uniref:DUF2269 family protein n=1 Tax=Paenibacillus sp. J22TS3 TaxID=2807192 RepID=UPI001B27538E|nr:DUF2269 family protein [Paenibacillus sp. J22TS3]GIP22091.1 hypothetical protein J22TS3_23660 [Paenibacillus sp. J22TS3]
MILLYKFLLYIHILSAIASIGPFFVLIFLVRRIRTAQPVELNAYLITFKSAIRLVKHMGHVLVVSGIFVAYAAGYSWNTSWIVATVLIMASSIVFLARAFSPKLRKFADPASDKADLVRRLTRSVWIYLALLLIMLWLMVAKPHLW